MRVTARCPVRIDFAGAWTDVDIYARECGGAVLNAAIDHYVEGVLVAGDGDASEGIRVEYRCGLPAGSGLGASSALNICWLSLVSGSGVRELSDQARQQIAEQAYQLEGVLGVLGGRQDQYAAAFGGFNYFTFGGAEVGVERLVVPPEIRVALEERLLLCYSGSSHLSSRIHENVWGAYRRGERRTVEALHGLRRGAERARGALLAGDLDALDAEIGASWEYQKALDASVTNETVERMFAAAMSAGATCGKACGAGGGGCLLFCAPLERRAAIATALQAAGARLIPFRFDYGGLRVEATGATGSPAST